MKYTLEIHEERSSDVTVIGGGTAGVFAAISAARAGAKTVLVEKNGVLGGTITAAGVDFPGLFTAWGRRIIDGPCYEAILRAEKRGGAVLPQITPRPEKHYAEQIRINPFVFAGVLDEMCLEAGVEVWLHTMTAHASEDTSGVTLLLCPKEGPVMVRTKKCVDCTGDANLTAMLGYETVKENKPQPATLIHRLGGYDFSTLEEGAFRRFLSDQLEAGTLVPSDYRGGDLWLQLRGKRITMHLSPEAAETSRGRTRLEQRARQRLSHILSVLSQCPGLEGIRVESCAPECGVRESAQIRGTATVTAEDYLAAKVYPDGICYAFYPIDRHIPEGIRQVFLTPERVPQIPYGALIPENSAHLLTAGRCVSADRDARSALRVQAPCMAMGQAAGTAAALAARHDLPVTKVDMNELKQCLKALGAIVPGME